MDPILTENSIAITDESGVTITRNDPDANISGHFAEVIGGLVTRVIVASPASIASGIFGTPSNWIQTSYNTLGGVNKLGGIPLRKNYAGIGYTYDSSKDAFIAPQPFNSWTLNVTSCLWTPPTPFPTDGKPYSWNESKLTWEYVNTKQ